MKFSSKDIQALLKASYETTLDDVGDKYKIDKLISDKRMKVYTVEGSKDVIVIHRGSRDANDWVDNALHVIDVPLTMTKTYKIHLRKHEKAVKKYGSENIILLSHSRGGLYSDQFYKDKLAKQNITYNKPVAPREALESILKKNDKNNITIRSKGDLPSMAQNAVLNNKHDILIPINTIDPLANHATEQLLKISDDVLIGGRNSLTDQPPKPMIPAHLSGSGSSNEISGTHAIANLFKSKIDYSKIRKPELKAFVKLHKAKLGVNITKLTKKELIALVEKLI